MKVTITEACGRCKRTAPREVELTEAAAIEAKQDARKKKQEDIARYFTNEADPASAANMPDLIVYFKGTVQMTDKICDAFCAETIKTTLEKVLFRPIDPTTRKPREKKEPSEKTPDSKVKEKKPSKKDASSPSA